MMTYTAELLFSVFVSSLNINFLLYQMKYESLSLYIIKGKCVWVSSHHVYVEWYLT